MRRLSKQRRNEIAWRDILRLAKTRPMQDFSVKKIHDELQNWLKNLPEEEQNYCCEKLWSFCNDYVEAVIFKLRKDADKDEVAFELSRDDRHRMAYLAALYYYAHDGIHIRNDMKRKVNDVSIKLKTTSEEAHQYIKSVCTNVLNIVLA